MRGCRPDVAWSLLSRVSRQPKCSQNAAKMVSVSLVSCRLMRMYQAMQEEHSVRQKNTAPREVHWAEPRPDAYLDLCSVIPEQRSASEVGRMMRKRIGRGFGGWGEEEDSDGISEPAPSFEGGQRPRTQTSPRPAKHQANVGVGPAKSSFTPYTSYNFAFGETINRLGPYH